MTALAPFVRFAPEAESGHAYLTAPELALIEEYQRNPQPQPRSDDVAAPPDDGSSDDATFGSHTALAARNGSPPRRWRRRARQARARRRPAGPRAGRLRRARGLATAC